MSQVAIVMGSDSDAPVIERAVGLLERFGIEFEVTVSSAHRSPARTTRFAARAAGRGVKVIIACAGCAAHLAGVIAAHTILPVIGVPVAGSPLGGVDALYSTVQMPAGVPVATMAIGPAGAANAAILATEILALSDERLRGELEAYRKELDKKVAAAARKIGRTVGK
jgi:phosphoribosylaminoimidazole carboxylase PurE protein